MIQAIINQLPASILRKIGRLQYESPILGPIVRFISRSFLQGEGRIKYGLGKGLKFDATGGAAGYLLGTSEPEEQAILSQNLSCGDIFYDIGANIGFYSTLAANIVGPSGHVYAFEPCLKSAKVARKNAEINGFKHVTFFEVGVSSEPGQMSLDVNKSSSVLFRLEESQDAYGEIPVVAIDQVIVSDQIKPPTLVMIDVEGHEIEVLRGMITTLKRYTPTIMCEVHWLGEEFIKFYNSVLRPLGYVGQTFDGQPLPTESIRYHAILTCRA
jgi:FkbM family methyltransferase